jgi:hypothetical protein
MKISSPVQMRTQVNPSLNLHLVRTPTWVDLGWLAVSLNTLKFLRKLRRLAINLHLLAIRLNSANASYCKLPQVNLRSCLNGASEVDIEQFHQWVACNFASCVCRTLTVNHSIGINNGQNFPEESLSAIYRRISKVSSTFRIPVVIILKPS